MDSEAEKALTIKEISFICKYKLHSKLLEKTIRSYLYKNIKEHLLPAKFINGRYLILESDFNNFIKENYIHLGFSYNPI